MVFAMEVDEIIDYVQYFQEQRFAQKIPDFTKGMAVYKTGDNIYKPLPNGEFRQLQSMHSNGKEENPETKKHDLAGRYVLIGKKFFYFGDSGPELPPYLEELKVARGHKNRYSGITVQRFLNFISAYPTGVNAPPTSWPVGDNSWRQE